MNGHQPNGAGTGKPSGWGLLGWFYDQGGGRLGPFSAQEMQRRVAAGEIARGHVAYVGWQKGHDVHYAATELRFALGEPEGPRVAAAETPESSVAARSTFTIRRAGSTEHGRLVVERRRHARRSLSCVISCRAVEGEDAGWWRAVELVDVAPGGVAIVDDRRFEANTALTVCFAGDGAITALLATARVVWAERRPGGGWLLGCRFTPELGKREFGEVLKRTGCGGGAA